MQVAQVAISSSRRHQENLNKGPAHCGADADGTGRRLCVAVVRLCRCQRQRRPPGLALEQHCVRRSHLHAATTRGGACESQNHNLHPRVSSCVRMQVCCARQMGCCCSRDDPLGENHRSTAIFICQDPADIVHSIVPSQQQGTLQSFRMWHTSTSMGSPSGVPVPCISSMLSSLGCRPAPSSAMRMTCSTPAMRCRLYIAPSKHHAWAGGSRRGTTASCTPATYSIQTMSLRTSMRSSSCENAAC